MGQIAQESSFSQDVTTYSEGDLAVAISKIRAAGDSYKSALDNLTAYFEGDLKDAVGGQTLETFKKAYSERRPALENVSSFINEMLTTLTHKTSEGADLAEDLYNSINANN
jgi:ABC-type transporter Mla subunit MlaD